MRPKISTYLSSVLLILVTLPALADTEDTDPVRRVTFDYGQGTPELVCSLTQPCAVWLEPGEVAAGTPSGDTVRWEVTKEVIGDQTIVFLKPRHCGMAGTLLWLPTRTAQGHTRLYAFSLRSECRDDEAWNPSEGYSTTELRFRYPLEWAAERQAVATRREQAAEEEARARAPFEVGALELGYQWKARESWAPVEVFAYEGETFLRFREGEARPLIWIGRGQKREMVTTTERGGYVVAPRKLSDFRLVGPNGRGIRVRLRASAR